MSGQGISWADWHESVRIFGPQYRPGFTHVANIPPGMNPVLAIEIAAGAMTRGEDPQRALDQFNINRPNGQNGETMSPSSTEPRPSEAQVASEFASWPMDETKMAFVNEIRTKFSQLQSEIIDAIPNQNGRYASMVKTHLEQACMMAVKGIAKPPTA